MYLCTRFPGWNGSSHCSQTQSLTPTYLYTHMRYTIYPVHTTYFVQRLLVRSVRQQVAKPQVLLMSQQNCSKQEERQHWTECTEYVWRSGKLVSGQRNGRSPHSSQFPRKVTLKCENYRTIALVSHAKQDPSSDHTGKDPSEDRNRNCRWAGRLTSR